MASIFHNEVNGMITLSKENITDYLKEKMPYLDFSKPLTISAIGEGTLEEDGDGYINFVYRVSDVMLMKAEALALRNDSVNRGQKDLQESFNLVKAVYYRSNPYNADSITYVAGNAESMQALVLEEF